ncbi:MAG: hypothetical protein LJE95_04895 [Acidobacteria bacterium]|nr:hypothetical protein [Acidobacteriota bacterium]
MRPSPKTSSARTAAARRFRPGGSILGRVSLQNLDPSPAVGSAVVWAVLSLACLLGYSLLHIRLLGGAGHLFVTIVVGVTVILVAAVLLSVLLRLRNPGWLVLWALVIGVFFTVRLAGAWHQVETGNRLRELLSRPAGSPAPAADSVTWVRYGRWVGLVRRALTIESQRCNLQLELRSGALPPLTQTLDLLRHPDIAADPYALAAAKGRLRALGSEVSSFRPRFHSFASEVRRSLAPWEKLIPPGTHLSRDFGIWREVRVCRSGDDLIGRINQVIYRESKILEEIGRWQGGAGTERRGYSGASVSGDGSPSPVVLRQLEEQIQYLDRATECR